MRSYAYLCGSQNKPLKTDCNGVAVKNKKRLSKRPAFIHTSLSSLAVISHTARSLTPNSSESIFTMATFFIAPLICSYLSIRGRYLMSSACTPSLTSLRSNGALIAISSYIFINYTVARLSIALTLLDTRLISSTETTGCNSATPLATARASISSPIC